MLALDEAASVGRIDRTNVRSRLRPRAPPASLPSGSAIAPGARRDAAVGRDRRRRRRWLLIVVFCEPWGRLWGTGQDARCYWQATLADPYLHSDWNDPIAYVYSPAFLQLVSPLTALPWQAFMAAWTALLIGAVRFLTGPRLLAAGLLFPFTAMEVAGGNVSLLLAAAIVLGFRWPATWSIVLLTKITPGIGLLWFAVRGEWRSLAIALGATAAIVVVSFVTLPDQWPHWVECDPRQRRQERNVGVGADPPADPASRGRRPRRVGRPDRPPLDGASRVDARPAGPLVRWHLDAAGRHSAASGPARAASAASACGLARSATTTAPADDRRNARTCPSRAPH